MTNNPLISVLCASYNHEKYVGYFITSLQNQSYSNWELIIVDDCSSDGNVEEIQKLAARDPRIHLFEQPFNQGPGAALNKAFSESKGEIIVEIASDDMFEPEYLQYVVSNFLTNKEIGVIYSSVYIVDENNKKYDEWKIDSNLNRITLLHQFFYRFNELLSPGLAVRREIYNSIIPMDASLIQHQDYQWHILFLLNNECLISSVSYVDYRVLKSERVSLGGNSISRDNRMRLEISRLMDTFLLIKDLKLIKQITGSELCDKLPSECYEFIWGYSALTCETLEKRQWGYNLISKVYADEKLRKILNEKIDYKFSDFLSLAKINYYHYPSFLELKKKALLKRLNRIFRRRNSSNGK